MTKLLLFTAALANARVGEGQDYALTKGLGSVSIICLCVTTGVYSIIISVLLARRCKR